MPKYKIITDEAFNNLEANTAWQKVWLQDWYSTRELDIEEALYYERIGNTREAMKQLKNLTDKRKSMHEAYAEYARILYENGELNEAKDYIDFAIARKDKVAKYYYYLSKILLKKEQVKKAEKAINKAISLDSLQISYFMVKAKVLSQKGEHEQAKMLGEFILQYAPGPESYRIMGNVLVNAQEFLPALKMYNKAIGAGKTVPEMYIERGKCYMKTATWAYADRDFSMAMDFLPNNMELYYLRGLARLEYAHKDKACSDWFKAMERNHLPSENKLKQHCQSYLRNKDKN